MVAMRRLTMRDILVLVSRSHKDVTESLSSANPALQRFKIKHTVCLFLRDSAELDGSVLNICVRAMMKTRQMHPWKGNLFVMSQPEGDGGEEADSYQDVTSADIRLISDFFAAYGKGLDVPVEPLKWEALLLRYSEQRVLIYIHLLSRRSKVSSFTVGANDNLTIRIATPRL